MNLRSTLLALGIAFFVLHVSAVAQNEGQGKLDEATTQKLSAKNPDDLREVIKLCEDALALGLDEGNTRLAKQILAASAMQRAEMLYQSAPAVARNPNALRRLRQLIMDDLEKAVKNNPNLPAAYRLMAEIEIRFGGSQETALENLNKAIALLSDQPVDLSKALVVRAQLRLILRESDEAINDLQKAIEADSTNADAWKLKISLQMEVGKFQEAVEDAEKVLEEDDSNMFALLAAVQSLLGLDKADEAIELLTKSLAKDQENKGMLYRARARGYLLKGDSDKALEDLQAALDQDERDTEAMILRAQIYFDQGEIDKANRDVAGALAIEPDSVQGVLMQSFIAAREGRYAAAIVDMERLVRADPSNVSWIMQLSSYYQMDNRPRKAIALLDEVVRNNVKDWRALRLRGDAKLSVSQHVEAIADYDKAIRILEETREVSDDNKSTDMDYSGLLNNLAWVLATSPEDSLRDGKKSVELGLKACEATDYEAAHILSTLAAGYAEIGDFENARKWSAKAVEIGEKDEDSEQLEQLKAELDSYKLEKPWREEQKVEENKKPVPAASDVIDT